MSGTIRRKKIAFLASHVGGPLMVYERALSKAVTEVAQEHDCALTFFIGGSLNAPVGFDGQRNFIYDLVQEGAFDGYLVASSLLSLYISEAEITAFLGRFSDFPLVSIGMSVKGIDCVTIDNYSGMRELVSHMVDVHKIKKPVFVSGPTTNTESIERLRAFRDVLSEHGIKLDSHSILPGNFSKAAGLEAGRILLMERGAPFDSIISANDVMAIGVMEYLEDQGISCPKDYLITGFDNLLESRLSSPALTTIQQNVYELGRRACEKLCAKIDGLHVTEIEYINTPFILRESCGCAAALSVDTIINDSTDLSEQEIADNEFIKALIAGLPPMCKAGKELFAETIEDFMKQYCCKKNKRDDVAVLKWLKSVFLKTEALDVDVQIWESVLEKLCSRHTAREQDLNAKLSFELLCKKISILLFNTAKDTEIRAAHTDERKDFFLQVISEGLINTSSMDQLRMILTREMPKLDIDACFMSFFPLPADECEKLYLMMTYRKGEGARIIQKPIPYDAQLILPPELEDSMPQAPIRIVEALNFRDEIMGILVFDVTRITFSIYGSLREQISSTLKNINTYSEINQRRQQIQSLNENLSQKYTRLSALRKIDVAITESRTSEELLQVLLEQVINEQKVDAAAILLFNKETNRLEFAAGLGFITDVLKYTRLALGEGIAGKAALTLNQVFIRDLKAADEELMKIPLFRSEGFRAYCAAPLIAHGELKGVLELFNRDLLEVDTEWHEFLTALAGQAAIALENTELLEGLKKANRDLTEAYDSTIEGWSKALELRDQETEGHSMRVARMAVGLARVLGLDADDLEHIYRGALLHDIGKVGIPDSILLKATGLNDEEKEIMYRHPQYAYLLLSPIKFLQPSLEIPYCHHEKWNGTGYPRGLRETEIPISARIFAIIDVWDALSYARPYREAWENEKIVEYIRSLSGIQFDPGIVEIFLEMMEKGFPV